jgi:DNA-binding PadR family transcriptional regulator
VPLEENGFIQTAEEDDDENVLTITLTRKGLDIGQRMQTAINDEIAKITDTFDFSRLAPRAITNT